MSQSWRTDAYGYEALFLCDNLLCARVILLNKAVVSDELKMNTLEVKSQKVMQSTKYYYVEFPLVRNISYTKTPCLICGKSADVTFHRISRYAYFQFGWSNPENSILDIAFPHHSHVEGIISVCCCNLHSEKEISKAIHFSILGNGKARVYFKNENAASIFAASIDPQFPVGTNLNTGKLIRVKSSNSFGYRFRTLCDFLHAHYRSIFLAFLLVLFLPGILLSLV